MPIPPTEGNPHRRCDECTLCKATEKDIRKITAAPPRVAESSMDCWCADLMGPFSTVEEGERLVLPSYQGYRYALVIVDEYSRYTMVTPLMEKSDASDAVIQWITQMTVRTGKPLKRFHCDNGSEFDNKTLKGYFGQHGIELTTTTPGTSEHNGIAEATNKKLETGARCMNHHAHASPVMWADTVIHAALIHNHLCQPAIGDNIPDHRFHGSTQSAFDLTKLHVFGCDAFVYIPQDQRGKFDARAEPAVYIGWSRRHNAHRLILLSTREEKISRSVTFREDSFQHVKELTPHLVRRAEALAGHTSDEEKQWPLDRVENHRWHNDEWQYLVYWKGWRFPTWQSAKKLLEDAPAAVKDYHYRTGTELTFANATVVDYKEPNQYRDAMKHPDREKWEEAIQQELSSHTKQGTWRPTRLPPGRKAIGCRWVFKAKRNDCNEIIRHKARLVVQGFSQQEGIDFTETYAPTVQYRSIKLLLAIAAQDDLEIKQIDFDTAFLNAELQEDIYMKIPEGYDASSLPIGTVLKLIKALYGLRQAPREWWLKLNSTLESLGYQSIDIDLGLYMKVVDGHRIYLTVYVDDTLAIYPKAVEHIWLADKEAIGKEYPIKDMDDVEWVLNMSVTRDRKNRTITLSQHSYVELLLADQLMEQCKPVSTPFLYDDLTVSPRGHEAKYLNREDHSTYRSIVGSLLYASIVTRIDIAYIVNVLCRYSNQPYDYHLAAARRVLKYLNGRENLALQFVSSSDTSSETPYKISIYADSDWGGERADRISVAGWIVTLNDRPINWRSTKQSTVALSSTEGELYAIGEAVREALSLRQWFAHYTGYTPCIEICEDNNGAMLISDHPTSHNRTKHIDIKHFFVRNHVRDKNVKFRYVPTQDQLADILTKATSPVVFNRLRERLLCTVT